MFETMFVAAVMGRMAGFQVRAQIRIAIAGAGISGFATLGYLVQALGLCP